MRSDAIKPGDVIAGKYRVRTILGRSHGFLVEAFHTEFDQRVVIRVLSPALCDEKEIERFRREARTLAKLESEHVARIIDVGTTPDGGFYLVRQYLEGIDLATHIKKSGALPLQQGILFVLQAAEAVAQTHVHSILLRELQPSHLFLAQRMGGSPVVKVIDFGTAKLMRDVAAPTAGGEMTATAMFGLSPYSSPELVRKAKNIDVRTDVWSLGAILYQCLAGRPPFEGEMAMLMLQIIKEDPVPLSRIRGDATQDLDNIIGWSLAKDVDGRFTNVYAFAHALTPFAPPEGHVLIQRIGEITNAAKQAKQRPAYAPAAPAADEAEDAPTFVEIEDDESVTGAKPSPAPAQENLDRTMFMGADYVPPSPGPPGGPSPAAPKPSGPGYGGGAAFGGAAAPMGGSPSPGMMGPAAGQSPQPQGSLLGPSLQFDGGARRAAMPSWSDQGAPPGGAQPAPAAAPGATGPGGGASPYLAQSPAGTPDLGWPPPQKSKNTLLFAIVGGVAALSVIAGLVVFLSSSDSTSGGPNGASTETAATSSTAAVAASSAPTPETPPVTPTAETVVSSEPVAPPPTPSAVAMGGSPTTPQGPLPGRPTSSPPVVTAAPKPSVTAAPAPTPTATQVTPPSGGGMGTVVAVAVGGSCAFSVNGSAKGSGSSVKVQVPPGTYSVSCKPSTGATKSKSVTVTSGGTAMAMFKLQ